MPTKKKPARKKAAPARKKAAKPARKAKAAKPARKAKKPARKAAKPAVAALAAATKLPDLKHHLVSAGTMDEVAHEGLRGDGEILHVEENEFSPCRLVDHGEGRLSLCFDDFRMPLIPLFDERGLQGGGYTWEALVESLVHMKRADLEPDLSYDSEAGMFVALGRRESLRAVARLIQDAIANPGLLQEALNRADPDRLE